MRLGPTNGTFLGIFMSEASHLDTKYTFVYHGFNSSLVSGLASQSGAQLVIYATFW